MALLLSGLLVSLYFLSTIQAFSACLSHMLYYLQPVKFTPKQ